MADPQSNLPPAHAAGADARGGDERTLRRRIDTGVLLARLALRWEDLWPRLNWPLGIGIAFLAVSWLGVWTMLPDVWRLIFVGLFVLAFVASFWALRGQRRVDREAALSRVEQASGYPHRPLQTIEDSLPEGTDAVSRALWTAHRARIAASIGDIRVGIPSPGVARADRYGLRVVMAMVLFVGFFAAGDGRIDRVWSAFRAPHGPAGLESRLDAWVTPPAYTGRPAILLTAPGGVQAEADGAIRVPQGSQLVIRTSAASKADVDAVAVTALTQGKTEAIAAKAPETASSDPARPAEAARPAPGQPVSASAQFDVALQVPTEIQVAKGSTRLASWRFVVDPDRPPSIKFVGKPEAQLSGTLKLTYDMSDDYGVVAAEGRIEPAPDAFKITSNAKTVRPLVSAPELPLSLPPGHAKAGQAQTFRDLTSHPWAGAKIRMTLIARDEAAQEGKSETLELTLPEKSFSKPLARALIEQRRILALDANRLPQVGDAMDALLFAPEHFYSESGPYLGVSKIYRDLQSARSDDDLRKVLDLIWQVATGIEDGNLSQAEKAVRDAEEALRKALENGASDKEIAKLTQDLRDALEKYMRELAEAQRNNPQARRPNDANQRMVRQQDLNKMLDKIENLAKTGSRDAARQMLSEMQKMLENMRAGRDQNTAQDSQQNDANDTLDKLGEMIQRQQQLMDKTHRLDRRNTEPQQKGKPGNDKPMTPEEMQQALKDLEKNQAELRKSLQEMKDKLAQQGLGKPKKPGGKQPGDKQPGQKGKPGPNGKPAPGDQPGNQPGDDGADSAFGDADEAMGEAKDALGEGDPGDATDAQGRALDSLREGARKLVDEMSQQKGNRPGGMQTGENPGDDPLGRPRRHEGPDFDTTVKVPGEIDVQRARRILDDIRRRLSEPMRPRMELDYLERLLKGE